MTPSLTASRRRRIRRHQQSYDAVVRQQFRRRRHAHLHRPAGEAASAAAKLTFVSSGEIDYQFNDGSNAGNWSVKVDSPAGTLIPTSTRSLSPPPSLSSVSPTSYTADTSNHTMQLFGSNFQSGDTLTFIDPHGTLIASTAAKLTFVSSSEIDYQFNDGGDPGTWNVEGQQPDGSHSDASRSPCGAVAEQRLADLVYGGQQQHTMQLFGSNFQRRHADLHRPAGDIIASTAAS